MRRDRLLSIGACAVEEMRLLRGRELRTILRATKPMYARKYPDPRHRPAGPGRGRGAGGGAAGVSRVRRQVSARRVSCQLSIRPMLDRALRNRLGVRLFNPWLDLAHWRRRSCPRRAWRTGGLDDWLGYFGLRAHARHGAAYDALATAELFLILLARARRAVSPRCPRCTRAGAARMRGAACEPAQRNGFVPGRHMAQCARGGRGNSPMRDAVSGLARTALFLTTTGG